MADEEIDCPHEQQGGQKAKKRRLHGACDTCRKRKIKCDSAVRPGNICSNCRGSNIQCTHDIPRQPKKKETQQAYIQSLEDRLSRMEHLFRVLHPSKDVEALLLDFLPSEVSDPPSSSMRTGVLAKELSKFTYPAPHLPIAIATNASSPESVTQESDIEPLDEEDLSQVELAGHLKKMCIVDKRFFGLASTYMFAHYTMHAKMEASGTPAPLDSKLLRRPLYWEMRPWELSFARYREAPFVYPEPDLLDSLVAIYFEKSNIIIPVLHKPTFLRSLNSGLHLRDSGFGMTVLLVCAIASPFSSDNRVLLDDDINGLSSGWKYYAQVPCFRNRLFEQSTLYDLQCYVLSVLYLIGTSITHVAWPLIGLGIRFAQEKGLHRRSGKKPTIEDELGKRVFWSLIFLDRWVSAFHGRSCAMQDEEFDLDYPIECDDEYWEISDPEKAFQQPPGRPCKITCFIWLIKLSEMLGFALRTLYATMKSKMLIGFIGAEWESKVVAELDSSMNKWKDSLPDFLRWNPENPDTTLLCQSITLYTCFYHLQIQIHRPFLMKRSPLSFTSFAMCTSAARSTAHVLEVAMSRGAVLFTGSYVAAFAAALVLLLVHQADSTFDSKTKMELVQKLFLTLKEGERKAHFSGRFVDLIQTLGCLNDHRSNPQLKRRREMEITDPPISQSQEHQQNTLREPGILDEPRQRQIATAELGPPTLMQTSSSTLPTNPWDVNNFLSPQLCNIQKSHIQQPFMTSQVGSNLTMQNINSTSPFVAGANFHPTLSSDVPHSLDPHPHLQVRGSETFNLSDDLFAMWSNLPVGFSPQDWDIFFSTSRS